ncbi:hypothetical protein TKK_0003762 [Trichogramma kaykai]|uniref:Phosphatidylinositol-glycan biosynthesis class X protein n=1 Tax=Trichogramma kaykai TaxID=54128 RepID=A0ABD2XN34_9HYME
MSAGSTFVFAVLLVCFYVLFALSFLPTATAVSVGATVKGFVEGEGFHRTVRYTVDTGSWKNKSCFIALYEELPSSVYVNYDELADLRRRQESNACVDGEIDVELFGERAYEQDVTACAQLISTKTTLSFPIHQRYHFSNPSGEPVDVTLARPVLLLGCKERIKDHRVSKAKICSPCSELTKKWRDVYYIWEGYNNFEWKIPVGNTSRKFLVTSMTHLVTLTGAAYVLWTIHKSFKVPKKSKDN